MIRWETLVLGAILALAAWLRFGWIGVNSFSFDEARVSHMALQMAREGQFAALGMQSSTGVPNFPAAVWLYAFPYSLTSNPQVAIWLTGLFSFMAVIGLWWLTRERWGKPVSLSVTLLAATSPYLVVYSRSVWSQNLLAPLSVLWAVTGVLGLLHHRRLFLALHIFLAGFAGQVHSAGFSLALASLALIVLFKGWRRWRALLAGAGLALLTALPTLYVIWRYGAGAKADLAAVWAQPATFHWEGAYQLLRLATGRGWEKLWLNADWRWPQPLELALSFSSIALGVLIFAGLIVMLRRLSSNFSSTRRGKGIGDSRHLVGLFLIVWALASPLFFIRTKTPVYAHYHLASLPALFAIAGLAYNLSGWRWWHRIVMATMVAIAVIQSIAVMRALTVIGEEFVAGGMGTPLLYPQAAVSALQDDNKPIVIETFGDNFAYEGDAAAFDVLLWEYPHQVVDARSALLIPSQPAHLFFTYDTLPAWEVMQAIGLRGNARSLPRRQGEPPYRSMTIEEVSLTGFAPVTPISLANGAELRGWQLQRDEEDNRLRLITYWRITNTPAEGHYQQFNHLYLAGETAPAAISDVYTSSRAWQQGDHLITWADFEQPASPPAYFDIGMYTWPDLQRIPVLDGRDDPNAPIRLIVSTGPIDK